MKGEETLEHVKIGSVSRRPLRGILHRIWKYKLHYIIVIPALLLIALFKIFPLITGIVMSFKNYVVFRGLWGSPWVGFDNFFQLFRNAEFQNAFTNTLIIKLAVMTICGMIAFVVALAVSGVRSSKLRNLTTTLILMPYFIPSVVVAYVISHMLAPVQLEKLNLHLFILGDPKFFLPMLVIVEALKTCGIPILLALAAIESKRAVLLTQNIASESYISTYVIPAIRAILAFTVFQLSTILSTDFELVSNLYNPLVYDVADTIDTFSFRSGLISGKYNVASTIGMIQFVVQLLGTFAAYLLVRRLFFHDLFNKSKGIETIQLNSKRRHTIGIVVSTLYAIGIIVLIYYICIQPFTVRSASGLNLWQALPVSRYVDYFVINFAAVIVNLFITATLAYPLTVKDLPGRNIYKLVLLFVLAAGSGTISEYVTIKSLGMINTIYPQMIFGFFAILNVFVVKSMFNSKYASLKEQNAAQGRGELYTFFTLFIPKVWKILIALGVLQFVSLCNSYFVSSLYMSNSNTFSPIMVFRTMTTGLNKMGVEPGDPIVMQIAAIITLPSLVLLLVFRKWLTSEVLISQARKM
ncbi:putative aldouronate transport system permease protein [Paenibacillus sp. V4I3]|nr:putative aldouronate transport system permease protein [Paenibacillus sp. V4I3]